MISRPLSVGVVLLAGSFLVVPGQPPRKPGNAPAATPASALRTLKDFKVELLYSVPADVQGSWVNLCVDPKGRLIVSDQYGGLYRVTPPALEGQASDTKVEKIDVPLGEAQGLLWAFDSLYVVVNRGSKYPSGLYRVRDTNGDDKLDKVELLKPINGGGEHGPHAVMLTPDGKNLTVVCGNGTQMVRPLAASRVPELWGEDHLLKRMPDGNGFMAGVLGPGGCIYQVDPEGKNWELLSVGFRNQYDAAYNRQGELFTYDADMEWDVNTPWYRPTRVNHATSGSEFGWRNGAGKWPAYYPDSLGAVVNVGPGSPTGVCFGYGARFPAKYQDAFFICDWSYGKLYAVHLTPHLSSYKGELEEFVTGSPLALTDVVINPKDGAMYFAVGGRKTQSGLYRVTYVGKESTAQAKADDTGAEMRKLRHSLEAFHGKPNPAAIEAAWPYLDHEDRYIRFAARVALEHQPPRGWAERALAETAPGKAINALLGLVRASAPCPLHRKPDSPKVDDKLKGQILEALLRIDWSKLTDEQRTDLLRTFEVALNRLGAPSPELRKVLLERFDPLFPSKNREHNGELVQLLVYLEAPSVVNKTMKLLAETPTQEEQMAYVTALRVLKTGWTQPQREEFFRWFIKAGSFRGGNSLRGFLRTMKQDAVASLSDREKTPELKKILDTQPASNEPVVGKPRPLVKNYKLDELVPMVDKSLKEKRDFDRGRRLFAEAKCFACHRFDGEGGSNGPDLTGVAGRFGVKDLLESIVDPNKVISDQYAAVQITTVDGRVVVGRIVNLSNDSMMVNTDMLDPNKQTGVNRKRIESIETSKVSMMPGGLLDTLKEDEIADLMAFFLSRGDRNHKMFR
ncbi:MAG: c-type cytochrome [Gemmataceae bacterium]